MLDKDPVYAASQRYLEMLLDEEPISDQGAQGGGASVTSSDYESLINRKGDILFRNAPGSTTTNWSYAMRWEHVGLYADEGQVYDSGSDPCQGVTLRELDTFFKSGNEVQMGQLANVAGRRHIPAMFDDTKARYGINC